MKFILKNSLFNDDVLGKAAKTVNVESLFDLTKATPDTIAKINETLLKNINIQSELKHVSLLNSFNTVQNAVNDFTFKAVVLGSPLGIGGYLLKQGISKGFKPFTAWASSKLNNIFRKYRSSSAAAGVPLSKVVVTEADVSKLFRTLSDITDEVDTVPKSILNNVGNTIVTTNLNRVLTLIQSHKNIDELIKALEEWAVKEGFDSLSAAQTFLKGLVDEQHPAVKELTNKLDDVLNTLSYSKNLQDLDTVHSALSLLDEADSAMLDFYRTKAALSRRRGRGHSKKKKNPA